MESVKIRGLARFSGWIFAVWGAAVLVKGAYDLLGGGEPEANLYAPAPWAFVSREQWARYAVFEAVYGAACLALSWGIFRYSRFLPEIIRRPRRRPEFSPFR